MLNRNNKTNRRMFTVAVFAVSFFLFCSIAGASSLVPNMTGTASPAPYVAFSSPAYSASYAAYKAFDGSITAGNAWRTKYNVKSGSLGVDLGSGNAKVVNVYRMVAENHTRGWKRAPNTFKFQGSNDGSLWVDLDVQSNVTGWVPGVLREFSFDNETPYRYYRLDVSINNTGYYVSLHEVQLDYNNTYVPPSASLGVAPVLQLKSVLSLRYPTRVAQDGSGDLYVADSRDGYIARFDKYGKVKGVESSVSAPTALAVGPSGDIYVASGLGGVYLLGSEVPVISPVLSPSVSDMTFDSAGYLYVADAAADEVRVFSPGGALVSSFGGGSGMFPVSVAVGPGMATDGSGLGEQIYVGYAAEGVASRNEAMVVVYEPGSWSEVRSFGEPYSKVAAETSTEGIEEDAKPYQIVSVGGIAVDAVGRVYIADTYSDRVVVFDEYGDYFTVTEGLGLQPVSVSLDVDGRLLVSLVDGGVRIYSVDGSDVENVLPTAPVFVSPVGGARVPASVDLTVKNSSDANGDALHYEFVVASDPSMGDKLWVQGGVAEGSDGRTSVSVAYPLEEDKMYYWISRSLDSRGGYSEYSPVAAFLVNGENAAPSIIASLPEDQLKKVNAEEVIGFSVDAFDPDRDRLAVSWLVDGELVSEWSSSFDFAGSVDKLGLHRVVARVADAEFVVTKEWDVEVYRPNTKPVPPAVASPVGGEDVASLNPVLTVSNSSDAEGDALSYTFQVSTVKDFSPGSIVATVSNIVGGEGVTSASVPFNLEENTLYYWRAMAVETAVDGSWIMDYHNSDYSVEEAAFFVNAVNDKSTTPSINYPSNGSDVGVVVPELVVDRSFDVDINDVLTYQFELSSLAGFGSGSLVSAGSVSPASADGPVVYSPGVELSDNTTYYWRSRAVDGDGLASGWMTAYFFVNTSNDAPSVPVALSPMSGAEVSSVRPELIAIESNDPDGDAVQYVFEIDSSSSFDTTAKQRVVSASPAWTVSQDLVENADYFWRVKATDGAAESSWSMVKKLFVNRVNDAPSVPVAKYPADSAVVNVAMPALGVYDSTDVDRDDVAYIYQVSKDSNFAVDVLDSGVAGAEWVLSAPLDENADYFWRSRSLDGHGLSSGWNVASAFRVNIANDPPSPPVINWQHSSPGSDVLLEINNSVDLDGDALSYEVQIYTDRAMSIMAADIKFLEEASDVTVANMGQLNAGIYYWRARAFDGSVYGGWSGSRVLRVDNAPVLAEPGAPAFGINNGRKRY